MGTMTFQLPADLSAEAARELQRTSMAGGPDNVPWPTDLRFAAGHMTVARDVDESGYVVAPWHVDGLGQLMGTSATLIERPRPYHLLIELARGKINQVRSQAFDWQSGGLELGDDLRRQIRDAVRRFGQAVTGPAGEADAHAQAALDGAYRAAGRLAGAYLQKVFQIRHERQERLDTALACRVGPAVPAPPLAAALAGAFNAVCLPLSWDTIEAEEASYHWEQADALVDWAAGKGLAITAGPLIDFTPARLPAWLGPYNGNLPNLATFMCRFIDAAVRRYRARVRRWQVCAASNSTDLLGLSEDNLLQLTYRLCQTARQADSAIEMAIGVAQPWGEYLARPDRNLPPWVFADHLIRSGLNLAALDVEILMGFEPRGSYCRDLFEVSRLLDLYALLTVPLRVTLGYPSSSGPDADADPGQRVDAGRWGPGFTPAAQADWAAAFAELALGKYYVHGVQWAQLADAGPHAYPHCGLLDRDGAPKPALHKIRELRERHLH